MKTSIATLLGAFVLLASAAHAAEPIPNGPYDGYPAWAQETFQEAEH